MVAGMRREIDNPGSAGVRSTAAISKGHSTPGEAQGSIVVLLMGGIRGGSWPCYRYLRRIVADYFAELY
jgi:hypothetical protein